MKSEKVLGEVVDNKDSTGGNRVRVKLYGYTEGIPVSVLPWYPLKSKPSDPNTFVSVPTVGTLVLVEIKDSVLNGEVIESVSNIPPN